MGKGGDACPPGLPRARPPGLQGRYLYDVDPVDGDQAWALFQACRDGEEARVRALIRADPDLVHAQYWYTQPVHFSVYANQPAVLRILLDAGAEPGRTRFMDSGWKKLLQHAEAMGFEAVREILLHAVQERFGYDAAFSGLKDAVLSRGRRRIEAVLGGRPALARASDVQGNNAIHWAVMTRQPELISLFCACGADPQHRRSDGQTPAQLLFNGDYEYRTWREMKGVDHASVGAVLRALVDAGAVPDFSVSCATGDLARIRALVEGNPDPARRLDSGRRNPLTYAARGGHLEVVRVLLAHGADPNMPEELAPRGHALWMACASGRADIAEVLLHYGANPNSAPDSSDSCLGIARSNPGKGARRIERLLRAHGAETPIWHMTNEQLQDAIVRAAPASRDPWFPVEVFARNDLDLAARLLEVDPDAASRMNGGTLRLGSPDAAITDGKLLERLLEAGFDPDRRGWLGQTALHHYSGRGETANVLRLLRHGAGVNVLDDESRGTPLAWAAASGHEDTVKLLLEHGADPGLPHDVSAARPGERARSAGHSRIVARLKAGAASRESM